MQRQSLSALIDSQDNLMLSEDGQNLVIVQWVDGSPQPVAHCRLDDLYDPDGNNFAND